MKRKFSLKTNLTVGMIGVWAVMIVILYVVFNYNIGKINESHIKAIKRDVTSKSASVANNIAFETAVKDLDGIKAKLAQLVQKDKDLVGIAVLDTKRTLLCESKGTQSLTSFISAIQHATMGEAIEVDDVMIGTAAVAPESGAVIGYTAVVRSMAEYKRQKRSTYVFLFCAGIIGIFVMAASAFYIGARLLGPIHSLVAASERIADGDLMQLKVNTSGFQEIERLSTSVKRMAEALRSQVLTIKGLISGITEISRDTEGTTTNLASSAAEQAAAVNETAATVEEMEKAGQSSALNAKHIVAAAEKTAEASKRGRETVQKTYEIIMQIKDDSTDLSEKSKNLLNSVEEVGNIIQSVNSIAEQSKILAVNASIEAAKAGEFGSGFAVVAQEVKDLAQQSKDATLQITGTLTGIRSAIETMVSTAQRGKERTADGVNTIANAGAVMNDLSEAIRENSDFAKLIATNIQQQTIGLTQIAAAVEEINTTALENQSISRNIAQGTKHMNDSLGQLSNMVGRWKGID
jgi:methyl-accepting chemotaxis protein